MQKIEKKVTFSGSLARRTLIICLLFLIIPLFVHTFFLYQREVEVAEADVRANLKAIGGEMAKRISDQIHFDWQLLNVKLCNVTLEAVFPIKKMAQGGHLSGQFAILNEKKRCASCRAGHFEYGSESTGPSAMRASLHQKPSFSDRYRNQCARIFRSLG